MTTASLARTALARVLRPMDDHAVEGRPDGVLVEGPLRQLEVGLVQLDLLLGLDHHRLGDVDLGLGLALLFLRDVVRVAGDQALVPGDDRHRQVLLGLRPHLGPHALGGQLRPSRRSAWRPRCGGSRSARRGATGMPICSSILSITPSRSAETSDFSIQSIVASSTTIVGGAADRPGPGGPGRSRGRRGRTTRLAASAAAFRDGCMSNLRGGSVCREERVAPGSRRPGPRRSPGPRAGSGAKVGEGDQVRNGQRNRTVS